MFCIVFINGPQKLSSSVLIVVNILDSDPTDECSSDNYLQFGRDILFVTTHLSNKICDNNTVIQDRHYTEIEVRFSFSFTFSYFT